MVAGQRLHDFLGGTNFTFDTPAKLQSGRPFAVTWLQKPGTQTNAYPLLFSLHIGGSDHFAVFQSPSDSSYSFVIGRLGSTAISFASAVGLMTSGTVDRYLATSSGGPLSGTASDWVLWRNGERLTAGGTIATFADSGSGGKIGAKLGGTYPYTGQLGDFGLFDGVPSSGEIREFFRNPHGAIYAPRRGFVFVASGGGGSYSLTCAAGSYTGTGQAVGLLVSRSLAAGQGSYTLSGQDVALLRLYTLTAAQGAYSLSGQALALVVSRMLAAGQGSYTLTGQAVGLLGSRVLGIGQGSYALTGQAVSLVYTPAGSYSLLASSGAYTLTGQAVGLLLQRLFAIGQGSYSLGGQSVGLLASRVLAVGQGSYALTGQAVGLTYTPAGATYTLTCSAGSYSLAGQALGFGRGYVLAAAAGTYTFTGRAVVLSYSGDTPTTPLAAPIFARSVPGVAVPRIGAAAADGPGRRIGNAVNTKPAAG
jgi:hypothetical protein